MAEQDALDLHQGQDAFDDAVALGENVARAVAAGEVVVLPFGGSELTLAPDELLIESAALSGYAVAQVQWT